MTKVEISLHFGKYWIWIGARPVGQTKSLDEALKIKKLAEEGIFG